MKKLILLILLLAMAAANATAARMYPAGGRVVDAQGQAVEYATVVLLRGGEQVAGMATDDAGRFELKVPTGEYTLSIQYLGFDPVLRQVRVDADNDLGDIVLVSRQFKTFAAKGLMKDRFHYLQPAYNAVGTEAGRNAAAYWNR